MVGGLDQIGGLKPWGQTRDLGAANAGSICYVWRIPLFGGYVVWSGGWWSMCGQWWCLWLYDQTSCCCEVDLRVGGQTTLLPQPPRVIISGAFFLRWGRLLSRLGRPDSLHVVGIPHSLAIFVSSWANWVLVIFWDSAAWDDVLRRLPAQTSVGWYCCYVEWR